MTFAIRKASTASNVFNLLTALADYLRSVCSSPKAHGWSNKMANLRSGSELLAAVRFLHQQIIETQADKRDTSCVADNCW